MPSTIEIIYTQMSLASEQPLSAVPAFDEAVSYRTDEQAAAVSRAIQIGDKTALMAMMTALYVAAIHRAEEIADIERDDATERADDLYSAWKDSLPAMLQAQVSV